MSYEKRSLKIICYAWEQWTQNGLGLDTEDLDETVKTVRDAVNNTYNDDIDDVEWLHRSVGRLRGMALYHITHADEDGERHQLTGYWVAASSQDAIAQMLAESNSDDDGKWQANIIC
jgi:hypothetical protein